MKRNCRRDAGERAAHEKAVRVRKMSDAQICDLLQTIYNDGLAAGAKLAPAQSTTTDTGASAAAFLDFLEGRVGSGNRIGRGTVKYLRAELEEAAKAGIFGEQAT